MKVKLEDIRARVDGELDETQAQRVDNAVSSDKELQQTADKLRASQLPYREAYNEAAVPDIADSLRAGIEALRNPATQHPPVQNLPVKNLNSQDAAVQSLPADAANNKWFQPAGIAASVMIASLVGYLGYQAGANKSTQGVPDTSIAAVDAQQPESFARTVAAYQKFYVRETLKGTVPPNPAKVSQRLADQTGMRVIIPELPGYEFMRAQRLSIDGELLLQLVYLGAEGGPLALCYMAVAEDDTAGDQSNVIDLTTLQSHHGLNTAEWRHSGHRFVIVSDASEKKLQELSQSTRRHWTG